MRWNTSFSVFVVLGTVKNYATAANENKFYFCYIQQWMSWPIFRVESSKRGGSANFAVFFPFYKYFLSEFCNGNSRVNTKSCIPKRSWQARISLLDRFLQKSTVLRPENTKGEGCHPGWSLPPNVRCLTLVNTIHEIGYLLFGRDSRPHATFLNCVHKG